jgi:hypothetical protein
VSRHAKMAWWEETSAEKYIYFLKPPLQTQGCALTQSINITEPISSDYFWSMRCQIAQIILWLPNIYNKLRNQGKGLYLSQHKGSQIWHLWTHICCVLCIT